MALAELVNSTRSLSKLLVTVALLVGLGASPIQAAENDKVAAKAHYETATRLYEVHEYADALKEYKAAYLAKPDPAFLFNIGECHRKMGKNDEAVEFFQQFLKKAATDDPNREQAESNIRNTRAGLTNDDAPLDKSAAQPFDEAPPQPTEPQVTSLPAPLPAAAEPSLTVGRSVQGPTTAPVEQVRKPRHGASVKTRPRAAGIVEVSSRENLVANEQGWWLGRRWTWVAAGAGLVLATGGTIAGMSMQSKFDSLNGSCGTTSARQQGCTQGDLDALDTRKDAANLMWGLAGVAVVTAGILFYVEGRPVVVVPVAGNSTGLVASVRY